MIPQLYGLAVYLAVSSNFLIPSLPLPAISCFAGLCSHASMEAAAVTLSRPVASFAIVLRTDPN